MSAPPLNDILNNLVTISSNIASIQFEKKSTSFIQDLTQKKKLVRDTDPNENRLAALCLGDSLLSKILDISKNTDTDDIARILRSANSLNQICQDSTLQKKIEDLASIYEERKINLDYLRTTQEKNEQEIDILTARNTEQNSHLDNTNNSDSFMEEVEDDEDEIEIIKLEQELESRKNQYNTLYRKKIDQLNIGKDIKELNLKGSSEMNSSPYKRAMDRIEKLTEEKELKKKRLNDYDAVLVSLSEDNKTDANTLQKPATTREIYTGFKARIEKLLKSPPMDEQDFNIKELTLMFKSIQTELKEILERFNQVQLSEKHMTINRSIYHRLLTFISSLLDKQEVDTKVDLDEFNRLFPHNEYTSVPTLKLSRDAIMITPILLKLFDQSQMKLSLLEEYVKELAKKLKVPERQATQCIYKLVAADLLIIDRTQDSSIVKFKLDNLE